MNTNTNITRSITTIFNNNNNVSLKQKKFIPNGGGAIYITSYDNMHTMFSPFHSSLLGCKKHNFDVIRDFLM